MTRGGEPGETPSSETPPAEAPPAEQRPHWRKHPLARRLPLLVLVALGLWLWQRTGTPTRELVWQLEGAGWARVRAIDFQLMSTGGELVEREERFYGASGPPGEVVMKMDLEPGTYRARLFIKREGSEERTQLVQPVTVGEGTYLLVPLRLPEGR